MKSKSPKIETNNHDDFLYYALIDLLKQIKLTRGANEVGFTLRNHPFLRDYLVSIFGDFDFIVIILMR